jgi:hypothetical protein
MVAKERHDSTQFFEMQHDLKVTQVYVSGGSARSQFILQRLEEELEVPCESWNPTRSLQINLPANKVNDLEYESPQLAVAIGAGLGTLNSKLVNINLLAEEQEAVIAIRRDPVRRARWMAGAVVLAALGFAGYLGLVLWRMDTELRLHESKRLTLEKSSSESINTARLALEMERTLSALNQMGSNRFLWAPVLNALQYTTVPEIEFHYLKIDLSTAGEATASAPQGTAPTATERIVMTIRGKNYGEPQALDRLVEAISNQPYFKANLRGVDPVLLKDLQPRQVDPSKPDRTFGLFTVECTFADRVIKHE